MKFSHILVPTKGRPVDEDAIALACQMARQMKGQVWVMYVIEQKRDLPLDVENASEVQQGEKVLEHAEQVAAKYNVRINSELLQARAVGPVLMEVVNDRKIDLIVMGVPYRPPLDELYLGTAVRYVIKNAACRVWLCREAIPLEKRK